MTSAKEPVTSYDWKQVTGRTVERLRAQKVKPCPPAIVRLAQQSWDRGEIKQWHAPTVEIAAEFAAHLKNAGPHTVPETSMSVVINPDPDGKFGEKTTDLDVSWKAGAKRGRPAAGTNSDSTDGDEGGA